MTVAETARVYLTRPIRERGEPFDAFMVRLEAWSRTPDGIAHDAEVASTRTREVAEERTRQQREIVERAGIPLRYVELLERGATSMTEAVAEVNRDKALIILAGKSGCGKTHAACSWLWDFIHADVTPARWPRFVPAGDLPRIDERDLFALRNAPRLVIDDLGMEYADDKGFFSTVIDRLLDWRYANLRPTVITTNLRLEVFKLRYQIRIWDRIREAGAYVEISNESLRKATP